jgi:L-ascorbate metabolism protein UlaG (beta-lactamase superfamily)
MEGMHWLHHASFRLEAAGKVIYFDPWKIKNRVKADYILISHEHYDHFSIPDIDGIAGDNTVIICPVNGMDEIKGKNVKRLKPSEKYSDSVISVEAVPAYNTNKAFHEKRTMKNGYVVEIAGIRLYHAGDTDITHEMKALVNISIAMVPVGGTYTMNPKEAAEAVNIFKPGIAVPMHWGSIVGSEKDAQEFKRLAQVKVEIMKEEEKL